MIGWVLACFDFRGPRSRPLAWRQTTEFEDESKMQRSFDWLDAD